MQSSLLKADEITLSQMLSILLRKKWWIIVVSFISAVVSIYYALSIPNFYRSEGVYSISQGTGGAGGLASQYGGLAAIAGINLNAGKSNEIDQAIALVKSWSFSETFITNHALKPYVMGIYKWDEDSREIIWDSDVFDNHSKTWVRETPPGVPAEPSSFESHKKFQKFLDVSHDTKTGLIKVSVEHYSPEIAAELVSKLVRDLNSHFQERDIDDAQRNINYLQQKISETNIADMRAVFYGMIEDQTQALMLAEVADEYMLKTVIAPKIAEERSKPNRALIVIALTVLGSLVSIFVILIMLFFKK
ncbi:Wzz/FepE/Etk N-terminal domain-containing protein [Glaciecola petra]|uniref:Wzz/FepE/Etk N-terminal domain-containing protein n=1 Tax=Glaciecola petra TaxID=3075602 RepID=A0ABU2ZNN3_9ALTE|nr:Wzz/FepE/Etk N-terminal domain-containing protein [Aestuariibacter sp. P117]MDT0593663.1 Wzz/FepE/Etk N-terminal domain-containing protein [Aestuariibacter sp. P117]